MARLFGTDGVRGVANTELTCELSMQIGRAVAFILSKDKNKKLKILVGKDTRLSSDMLECALISGCCSMGANVVKLGVISTPAVAYLTKHYAADAGIMISASHNPFEFNGIKVFKYDGYKISEDMEEEIENIVLDRSEEIKLPSCENLGVVTKAKNAKDDYIAHLKDTIGHDLSGLKVAIDCSNGASFSTAEKLFSALGAECFVLSDKPDGTNINKGCGSTHIENLVDFVKKHDIDAGFAFDGDADRCIAIDEKGNVLDGDYILAICSSYMRSKNKLAKNTVVGTVMSNMGVYEFLGGNSINFVSSKVGDKYVLMDMLKGGFNLGGEQSGHIIFLDHATTGDGQLTAIQLLSIIKDYKEPFSKIASILTKYPQVMVNVVVCAEGKKRLDEDSIVQSEIKKVESELSGKKEAGNSHKEGRVLVRASGTEPLIRVMLEGKDLSKIKNMANRLADLIKARLS
ncbi:MAG: phosphoglucosamine mutase [Clostridia bacterium]|nr:phosphoglucosamine mutase [Clostridia bacterium]